MRDRVRHKGDGGRKRMERVKRGERRIVGEIGRKRNQRGGQRSEVR